MLKIFSRINEEYRGRIYISQRRKSLILQYDYFRINLSENDAHRYAKELLIAEEKLITEIKISVGDEVRYGDFVTKKDLKELEVKMEKGFKEVIIWVVGFLVALTGLAVAIIKFF